MKPRYVHNELLVQYRGAAQHADADAQLRGASGVAAVRTFRTPRRMALSPMTRWRRVSTSPGTDLLELRSRLLRNPNVERVELNYEFSADQIPNDPRFPEQWGLGESGGPSYGIRAPLAWDVTTGSTIPIVAVLDSGIDYAHEDLAANMWTNTAEIPANGLDDDGNGYADDVHGYDFLAPDSDPTDLFGHGTHVAGIIGAVGDNGIGVAGIAWETRLMALRVVDENGNGNISAAIEAILYAVDNGARILNASWGDNTYSQALADAIATANAAGALFVAAAGGAWENTDRYPHYPASYELPNVVSVAALDQSGHLAAYSNYGANSVDLAAPGANILSTMPNHSYGFMDGTSAAAPHVSGAAALLLARYPTLTVDRLKARLLANVDTDTPVWAPLLRQGSLDLPSALEVDDTAPAPVTNLTATDVQWNKIGLSWPATGDDGPIGQASYYDVRRSMAPIDETNFDQATPTGVIWSPGHEISGLEPNTIYYLALRAFDNVGNPSPVATLPEPVTTQYAFRLFFDDLENGLDYWTLSPHYLPDESLWHIANHRYASADSALYYGIDGVLNYDTSPLLNRGALVSAPIDLSGLSGATLRFKHYKETGESPPEYDAASVSVWASECGVGYDNPPDVKGPNGSLVQEEVDVGACDGERIQIELTFDTQFEFGLGDYEGWVVDDLELIVSSPVPPNYPPQISWALTPTTIGRNDTVTFDASGSTDPEGDAITFTWDFGDGATSVGAVTQHTFSASGTYTVTIIANDGHTSSAKVRSIDVVNAPPTALLSAPVNARRGEAVMLDASASSDADGDTLTYAWDPGDGTFITSAESAVSHVYTRLGTFTASVQISDGEATRQAAAAITVVNEPPIASLTAPSSVHKGELALFDASASYDPDGDDLTYHWDLGDGGTATGPTVSHMYVQAASFTVTVTVSDGLDATTSSAVVSVINDPPVPQLNGPSTINKAQIAQFDASASSDPNGDSLSFAWDFGDGATATGPAVTHQYAASGIYVVSLTVSDGSAQVATEHQITVTNEPPVAAGGPDLSVVQQTLTQLDGTGSHDPEGGSLAVQWRQMSGEPVTLNTADRLVASFTAPRVRGSKPLSLQFELTLVDDEGLSATDLVTVTVTKK